MCHALTPLPTPPHPSLAAGGGTAQASSMRHPDLSRSSIKQLHRKMQEYRNMRDEHDEELRCVRVRCMGMRMPRGVGR